MLRKLTDQIHKLALAGDTETSDECEDLSALACSRQPRSFLLNLANGTCSKLAEKLAGPEIVLPLLMNLAGIPTYFVSMLMPVRQAGSLLPQLLAGGLIRRFAIRKWFWSASALFQGASITAILWLCLNPAGSGSGPAVVTVLLGFSIASGIASISFKEVLAKTIARGRRGRLLAARATVGGALALSAGALIQFYFVSDVEQSGRNADAFAWLLGPAAGLWLLAAALFAMIPEEAGAQARSQGLLADIRGSLRFLRERDFALFLLSRGLLLAVPLAMPFFSLLALEADRSGASDTGGAMGRAGTLMIALAASEILSSTLWGRLADRSSRLAMSAGGLLFVLCCTVPALKSMGGLDLTAGLALVKLTGGGWLSTNLPAFLRGLVEQNWSYTLIFFLLGVSYAGVRLGRKTYIVDAAPAEYRSLFVALGNSAIGMLTLVWGLSGVFLEMLAPGLIIPVLGALGLAGALLALFLLPRPQEFCRRLKVSDSPSGPFDSSA